jgi:hypothetical protein
VIGDIESIAPQLRACGKSVSVIIASDGEVCTIYIHHITFIHIQQPVPSFFFLFLGGHYKIYYSYVYII